MHTGQTINKWNENDRYQIKILQKRFSHLMLKFEKFKYGTFKNSIIDLFQRTVVLEESSSNYQLIHTYLSLSENNNYWVVYACSVEKYLPREIQNIIMQYVMNINAHTVVQNANISNYNWLSAMFLLFQMLSIIALISIIANILRTFVFDIFADVESELLFGYFLFCIILIHLPYIHYFLW